MLGMQAACAAAATDDARALQEVCVNLVASVEALHVRHSCGGNGGGDPLAAQGTAQVEGSLNPFGRAGGGGCTEAGQLEELAGVEEQRQARAELEGQLLELQQQVAGLHALQQETAALRGEISAREQEVAELQAK